MKKNYMKPDMKVVALKCRQRLLTGSGDEVRGTRIRGGNARYEDETL